eukprot:11444036-Alexandrium_andersonii.AAC.1
MEEAAAPSRPAGRDVLVPPSASAEVGDPEVSALPAGGAALRTAPQRPELQPKGSPTSADSERGTR